ncbi:hypothetical protein H9P43_009580 [Blastocladiella emersonii ATCC 22665]|nr:hypothetical protein H9P43_009580 [Blastocladiella emersonii ATCC 22665]
MMSRPAGGGGNASNGPASRGGTGNSNNSTGNGPEFAFKSTTTFMLGAAGKSSALRSGPRLSLAESGGGLGSKHFAKKLVVRDLKVKPVLPPDFRDTTWSKLRTAIRAIFAREPVPYGLEDLYRACEALCHHNFGAWLHAQVADAVAEHARAIYTASFTGVHADDAARDPLALLRPLVAAWDQYTDALRMARAVLLYLDRTYALPGGHTPLWDFGLRAFADHVYLARGGAVRDAACNAVVFAVRRLRGHTWMMQDAMVADGEDAALRAAVAAVAKQLDALGMYTDKLESVLVATSERDFAHHAAAVIRDAANLDAGSGSGDDAAVEAPGATHYLHYVRSTLAAETALHALLPASSGPLLTQVLQAQLVSAHLATLLAGVDAWLSRARDADLRTLFGLLRAVGRVVPDLRDKVYGWTVQRGSAIVLGATGGAGKQRDPHGAVVLAESRKRAVDAGVVLLSDSPQQQQQQAGETAELPRVDALLILKVHLEHLVASAFASAEPLVAAAEEAFAKVMNAVKNKPAEDVAKYLDSVLRSRRIVDDATLARTLDHVMQLFRHIHGKDTFHAFYQRALARRLLTGKVTSDDAEKAMLTRLEFECGREYAKPLEEMFHDVTRSKELRAQFADSDFGKQTRGVDLDVIVCQGSVWPAGAAALTSSSGGGKDGDKNASAAASPLGARVQLPAELAAASHAFTQFYKSQHEGRALTWQLDQGSVILRAWYNKELVVSLAQALVLMAFNDDGHGAADVPPTLGFKDLAERTGLDVAVLRHTLQGLACGKLRLLKKSPPPAKGGEVHDTDQFRVVEALPASLAKYRIRVPQLIPREVEDADTAKTHEQVKQDRSMAIEAAIVRVLKTRKRLPHAMLFKEVCDQCKFPIESPDFKKCVEGLLQREFIERDAADKNVYNYVA